MAKPRSRVASQLPWPDAWERERKHQVWSQRLGIALLLFVGLMGVVSFSADPPDVTFGVLDVFLGLIFLATFIVSYDALTASAKRGSAGAKLQRVRSSADQVVFAPYTRAWELSFLMFTIAVILMLLALPWIANDLASVGGDSGAARLAFFAEFGPYLTVLGFPYLLSYLIRGRRRMGLGLSPEGVYHWSWFGCVFTPWQKISYVAAIGGIGKGPVRIRLGYDEGEVPHDRNPEENWLGRFSKFRDGKSMANVGAGHLAIHPALAYWALTFYLEHPEHRAELGTQAAIDRFRKADFPYPGKHDPGQLPRFRS